MTAWTADDERLLRELAAAGHSGGMIARRLPGKSRQAVIGKAIQLGVRLSGHHMLPRTSPVRRASSAVAVTPADMAAFDALHETAAQVTVVPLPFSRALEESRCLFFAADAMSPASPDMLVCGCLRAARLGKPYCATHRALERRAA